MLYAIAHVHPDWTFEQPLGFSLAQAANWQDDLEAGTKLLVYKSAPVNAIIGEVELTIADVIYPQTWPEDARGNTVDAAGNPAEVALPLRVLYRRQPSKYVPYAQAEPYFNAEILLERGLISIEGSDYRTLIEMP
jgi:hypothetical protein